MQLSDYTKKLLENFVSINAGIVIRKTPEGANKTLIRTIDRSGHVYSQVEIPEVFKTNVTLHDLKAFLNVISGFNSPEITINDSHLVVSEGSSSVKIVFAEPNMITHPQKPWSPPKGEFDFDLKQDTLAKVMNFSNYLSLPHLRVYNKNGVLVLQALDRNNPDSNNYDIEVGVVDPAAEIDVYLKRELIKMIAGDYTVSVNPAQAATFTNMVDPTLVYFVALDIVHK